ATWAAFPLRPRKRRSATKMQICRSVPGADSCTAANSILFDHFIGQREQREWPVQSRNLTEIDGGGSSCLNSLHIIQSPRRHARAAISIAGASRPIQNLCGAHAILLLDQAG